MAKPVFKLQIVLPDGKPITFAAAGQFERDLVESLVSEIVARCIQPIRDAIVTKGVGVFRTQAHVSKDIDEALKESLGKEVERAIKAMLYNLKAETLTIVKTS